jgi:SAM-dependent methyltransferase
MPRDPQDTRQFGLEAGQLVARFFMHTEDLHWGLWPEGLPVNLPNMRDAQRRHSELILAHIPPGTQTILDVGGGSGQFAEKLAAAGFAVDVVSPRAHLAARIKERLPDESHVYVCGFEEVEPRRIYDLVMFSESFQYIKLDACMERIKACTRPGGHALVCDYFRMARPGKPPVGGGHRWAKVETALSGQPLELVTQVDVTAEAAPTCELMGQFIDQVAEPMRDLASECMTKRHPVMSKLIGFALRKKITKLNSKYRTGRFTSATFLEHFTYQLLIWRRTGD